MNHYRVIVSYCYHTSEGPREKQSDIPFLDASDEHAIFSAARWAKARFLQLGPFYDLSYIGCVKLYAYIIDEIDIDGKCGTITAPFPKLEWKCDTGLRGSHPAEVHGAYDALRLLRQADWQATPLGQSLARQEEEDSHAQ